MEARDAHNVEVGGSSPPRATSLTGGSTGNEAAAEATPSIRGGLTVEEEARSNVGPRPVGASAAELDDYSERYERERRRLLFLRRAQVER